MADQDAQSDDKKPAEVDQDKQKDDEKFADENIAPPDVDEELQDPAQIPRDARLLALLIHSEGVQDYCPKVLQQLLEFMHRYAYDMLKSAQVYAEYAKNKEITPDDLLLAIQAKTMHSFLMPPNRDVTAKLAEEVNSKPIPIFSQKFGVQLPQDAQLTSENYQISVGKNFLKEKRHRHFKKVKISPKKELNEENSSEHDEPALSLDFRAKKKLDTSDEDYANFV